MSNVALFGFPSVFVHGYRGSGILRGTLMNAENNPVVQSVVIMAEQRAAAGRSYSKLYPVWSLRSDASGEWKVTTLDENLTYTAIAYDDTGQFDPAIKAGLIPEPME